MLAGGNDESFGLMAKGTSQDDALAEKRSAK